MISLSAVWAIALRHLRLYKRDPNFLLINMYWPLLDIITWGFLGLWIAQSGTQTFNNYEMVSLLGVLLWLIVGRGANTIAFGFTEEIWSNNILNLFSLPLRMAEWIGGIIVYFLTMMMLTISFSFLFIYSLYNVPMSGLLHNFLLFAGPLFFCAIWLGFIFLLIVTIMGKRGMELGFVSIWFLLPFSGAYYPIDILPAWGKAISSLIPMSYIFTAMRQFVGHQHNPLFNLMIGTIMSIVYAGGAIGLFIYAFNRSKQKGLVRLMD